MEKTEMTNNEPDYEDNDIAWIRATELEIENRNFFNKYYYKEYEEEN
jgi:hypothetical protein